MNSREQSKLKFSELLREDAKKARKCLKGKECGGRCIPANWNCRLKGEGETPPTRGNLATLSPELKNKIATRRRNENLSNFTKLALAAGGAAAAGAVLNKRGVSPQEVTQGAATAAGLVSALNPAISGPVTIAAVAAGAGAGLANASSKAERFKARVTGVSAAAVRTRKLIAQRRAELAADRKAFNELQEKIQKTTDDKQRRRFIAESKVRLKQIGNNEERIKALSESVTGRERLVTRSRNQGKITLGKVVKAATKGANEGTKTARSIRSQSLKNRSALGLTALGQPGAKVKFSDWRANPRNIQDSVDVRSDLKGQKCGGSYISPSKKCSRGASGNAGSSARAIAKGLAATALIAGGAAALSMAGRSSKTPFARGRRMTRSEVAALKRMRRLKPRGMYETKKLRSFTSARMPYYTEADRTYPVMHKRLFRDSENIDAEGKKYTKSVTDKSSRKDAGDKRVGKPCGASHISKAYTCNVKSSKVNTAAQIAIGAGAVIGSAYLLKKYAFKPKDVVEFSKAKPYRVSKNVKEGLDGLSQIGEGADGAVYLSKDGKTAFKQVHKPETVRKEVTNHLRAQTAGVKTATIQAYDSEKGIIKMEALTNHKPLPRVELGAEARHQAAISLANNVSKLHGKGMTHGDLSGRNILVDKNGDTRLIDFARSKLKASEGERRSEMRGFVQMMAERKYITDATYQKSVTELNRSRKKLYGDKAISHEAAYRNVITLIESDKLTDRRDQLFERTGVDHEPGQATSKVNAVINGGRYLYNKKKG